MNALHGVDGGQQVVDDGLVHRRLLGGERGELLGFQARRQIHDHPRIGLEPSQHERVHELTQRLRPVAVTVPLDGHGAAPPELLGRPQVARVAELHDRPQLGEPVLHGCPGQRHPARRPQVANGDGLLGRRILDELRLVEDHAPPGDLVHRLPVARHQRVGGDHDVAAVRGLDE